MLCEKPMATTLADCIEMTEVAKRTGNILMIGQNQRYAKAHLKAKELLKSGEIGTVLSFRTTFGHGGQSLGVLIQEVIVDFLIKKELLWGPWQI